MTRVPFHLRSAALRHYHRRAAANVDRGLTVKGRRRRRRANARNFSTKLAMRRERGLNNWNLRVIRLRKLGLTTRGTRRIMAVRRGDALLLKGQLDRFARALAKTFAWLPASSQADALELENHLGGIRRQLI